MIVDVCGEISCSTRTQPQPTLYEARGVGRASLPTLTVSDAKRGAYHKRRVSDAPIHSVSSRRCGYSFAPIYSAPMPGRAKALDSGALLRGYEVKRLFGADARLEGIFDAVIPQLALRGIAGWD